MSKIMHITCTYIEERPFIYPRELTSEGSIIVTEDGWFEGTIDNSAEGSTDKSFVFGLYTEEKIDLYRVKERSVLMFPYNYECFLNGNNFTGKITIDSNDCGIVKINISELNNVPIDKLAEDIFKWRIECLIGISNNMYYEIKEEHREKTKFLIEKKALNNEAKTLTKKKYKIGQILT